MTYFEDNKDMLNQHVKEIWESKGSVKAGTWKEVFGDTPFTKEFFMAWQYADYIDEVARVGKEQYPLPMFVNAWLVQYPEQLPGGYPTGGPVSRVIDIYKAAAGHLDILTPDIYLPDFKYYNDKLGKYSNISNYFETASLALKEMYRRGGKLRYNKDGILVKGMIVRHLVLPNNYDDSKKIIKYLYDNYKDNIIISIMNQYTIIRKLEYSELNDKVDEKEYDEIINYAYDLGIRNAFIQEGSSQSDSFIPSFKGDMII